MLLGVRKYNNRFIIVKGYWGLDRERRINRFTGKILFFL
jgi:hypothetical protein